MFILSLLGYVVLFLTIASFVVPSIKSALGRKRAITGAVGLLLASISQIFFWNPAGTVTAVQYPWGGDKMVNTQGLKVKMFGRTIPMKYEISMKDIITVNPEEVDPIDNGEGLYNRVAKQWEFQDAIKAKIGVSVIAGLSITDEEKFLNMADRNGTEARLVIGRIIPNIDAAIKNTCKLMDAQQYISGKSSDFDRYFKDQLENGMYLVEEYTEAETPTEVIGDTTTIRTVAKGKSNRQSKWRIKRDARGNIMRDTKSNTLGKYGVTIQQAIVTGIDWEQSFDKRLQLQKEQVAQTQLEKQEAEKEFYRAKKEIAKGESEKAKERARLEKEQIRLTIAAETRAKVAKQDLIAEKKRYEVEQFKAKSKRVMADAQAYENQRLVSAGLTPQERAEWEYKKAIGVAQQLKELRLPSTYIEGGAGKDSKGNLLESLIGAELAKGMLKK